MITDVTITISPDKEKDEHFIRQEISRELTSKGIKTKADTSDMTYILSKKSVDARRRMVKLVLRYKVYIGEKPEDSQNSVPQWKHADGTKKVIIIDDSLVSLNLIKTAFADSDWEVYGTRHAQNALKMLYDIAPDIIITDALMPVMGGFQFLKELRKILQV